MENIGLLIKGTYRDILTDPEGKVLYDSGWNSNTIVNDCRKAIAMFMIGNNQVGGIMHLRVGEGHESWDNSTPPPIPETSRLVAPSIDPIEVKQDYLTEKDEISTKATSRLQITTTLGPGCPAPIPELGYYPLREFGLFGGISSTTGHFPLQKKPYMINCVRHPRIDKDAKATLVRVIRLYF